MAQSERQSRRRFIYECAVLIAGGMVGGLGCNSRSASRTGSSPLSAGAETPNAGFRPAYLALHERGELKRRADALWERMERCNLCPRECGVNRLAGERGQCRATSDLIVSSYHPHFGEEDELVGRGGSGTIFFCGCASRCVFCINWEISQTSDCPVIHVARLAEMMLELQQMGCANINVVTPTHFAPHILRALDIAAARGLRLPLVYNTCGWERLDVLAQLDGVVDIYLPDHKWGDAAAGLKYSGLRDYPETTQRALLEMHRQVGVAKPSADGLIRRGLMIRHLVMPNRVANTRGVLKWIAENLPRDTYVNLMSQYRPTYRAHEYPEINRRLTRAEYAEALDWAQEFGLTNVREQPMPWL
ncbi:MAG: radical SAM protein [Verrucomicrobiae bacterium]|nr:radical SAM protein [Verrucomicrobiae bacterium]